MNNWIKKTTPLFCFILLSSAYCQQTLTPNGTEIKGKLSISDNNGVPSSSAILDIQSNTKGVRLPVMSSSQRKAIVNPVRGLTVFDSDYLTLFLYDGYGWYPLAKTQTQYLPAVSRMPNGLSNSANFGTSVSIEGETIVAGAPNQNNNKGEVYIYERLDGIWNLKMQITGSDLQSNDLFGSSVLIKKDYILVSAKGSNSKRGAVYVFKKDGSTWRQRQKITLNDAQNNDHFGHSIALNSANTVLAISAPGKDNFRGSVYIYNLIHDQWQLNSTLNASNRSSNDQFGFSIALENSSLVIGSPFQNNGIGEVHIFQERPNGTWSQSARVVDRMVVGAKRFGYSVSISNNVIAVSGPGDSPNTRGFVFFILKDGSANWYQGPEFLVGLNTDGNFGSSLHISDNYLIVAAETEDINGITDKGCAYVYFRSQRYSIEHWEILRKIYANDSSSETLFGKAVSVSNDNYVIGQPLKNNSKGEIFMGKIE